MNNFPESTIISIIGGRCTGKKTLVKDLLSKQPLNNSKVIVVGEIEENNEWYLLNLEKHKVHFYLDIEYALKNAPTEDENKNCVIIYDQWFERSSLKCKCTKQIKEESTLLI
jgi:hypothetical protein